MRQHLYGLPLLLILLLLLSGCSNVKQLNRISFVTAVGVDKGKSGVLLHALIAVPGKFSSIAPGGGGGAGSQNPNYVLSQEGTNIGDALYKLKRQTARDLHFGHTRVILFSEELAAEGFDRLLDIFMRREEFQINAWIAIAKGSTKHILQVQPEVPESITDYMVDIFSQTGSDTMEVFPIFLYQFYSYLHEPGRSPYALKMAAEKEGSGLQISGLGVFHKEKMVGTLTPKETKFLQLVDGHHLKSTSFALNGRNYVLLKYKSKQQVTKAGIKIDLNFQLELEQNPSGTSITTSKIRELESSIAPTIQADIVHLIKKLQSLKTDPAGFGEKYRVTNGGYLQADEWLETIFPNLPVSVTVKAHIERTGMLF